MFGNKDSLGSIMNCFSSWNNLIEHFYFPTLCIWTRIMAFFNIDAHIHVHYTHSIGTIFGKIKIKSTTKV